MKYHCKTCGYKVDSDESLIQSKFYKKTQGLSFIDFYDIFLDFCRINKSIFSEQYEIVLQYIENGYSGKGWDFYDSDLGEIYWPIEEATWAKLAWNENKLKDELIMKNQNEKPAVTASDLNRGEEVSMLYWIDKCN